MLCIISHENYFNWFINFIYYSTVIYLPKVLISITDFVERCRNSNSVFILHKFSFSCGNLKLSLGRERIYQIHYLQDEIVNINRKYKCKYKSS